MLSLSQCSLKGRPSVAMLRVAWLLIAFVALPVAWPAAVTRWLAYGLAARPHWAAVAAALVAALVVLTARLPRGRLLERARRQWLYGATGVWILAHLLGWSSQASGLSDAGVALGYLLATVWIACCVLMASGRQFGGRAKWLALSCGSLVLGLALIESCELDGGGHAVVRWRLRQAQLAAKELDFKDERSLPRGEASGNGQHDFPSFRGSTGTGRVGGREQAKNLRDTALSEAAPRLLWRQSVGSGWGGFAVVDGLAYSQEQRGDDECVVCYQARTAREVWRHADRVEFVSSTAGDGPRATPTVCDGRVYTLGGTGRLNCLDALTGARLWSVDVLADNSVGNQYHGVSCSPLVLDEMVVVSVGGPAHSLVAYNAASGARLWTGGDDAAGYGSPLACTFDSQRQIVILNAPGIAAHDPATGKILWSFSWKNDTRTNCSQPVQADGDRLLVSTGYGKGSVLLRVSRSAEGWSAEPLWANRNLKTKFSSAVVTRGHAFGLDEGILTCLRLADGSRCWKAGRYGHGQLLLVGDLLLVQCEDGQVAVVAADSTIHRELARWEALDGKTWNYPALAGRLLLVRNDRQAACFELFGASSR